MRRKQMAILLDELEQEVVDLKAEVKKLRLEVEEAKHFVQVAKTITKETDRQKRVKKWLNSYPDESTKVGGSRGQDSN